MHRAKICEDARHRQRVRLRYFHSAQGIAMKRAIALFAAIVAVLLIAGCGGGSSAPAPANVNVVVHDSSATISWDQDPGVEYWVWVAAIPNVTADTCAVSLACVIFRGVSSPFLITGLINGQTYSAVINGRTDGGPGGPRPGHCVRATLRRRDLSAGAPLGAGNCWASVHQRHGDHRQHLHRRGRGWKRVLEPRCADLDGEDLECHDQSQCRSVSGHRVRRGRRCRDHRHQPDRITWTTRTSGTANNLYR
jgi:hypothetical protein